MAKKEIETKRRYSPLKIPRIIRSHWNAKPKEPAHFIGEPSTVKSEMVFAEGKVIAEDEHRSFFDWNRSSLEEKRAILNDVSKYFVFADIRASETEIGELRLQEMRREENYITYKYALLFEVFSKKDAMGILFLDELNLAPAMVKAGFYKIINDRCIGDIPINKDVLIISAGNESEHARGVTEDPVPLVLRRANYFIRPLTSEEFSDYAVKSGQHEWIIGYLGFAPHNTHKIEYDLPESSGQPCPRTWTKLSNVLVNNKDLHIASANDSPDEDDVELAAIGFVGQGVGIEFGAYVRTARKLNIDEILKHPAKINEIVNPNDLSIAYAVVAGVVEKFRNDKKVIVPAFEIASEINRIELGTYLLRCLKAVDEQKFVKEGGKLVPDVLMRKVLDRFAKFVFKQ